MHMEVPKKVHKHSRISTAVQLLHMRALGERTHVIISYVKS